MNKAELISAIASDLENTVTKKTIERVVNSMTNVIGDEIANGEKVLIVGFGAFEAVNRKEREGRNPKTGEKILIPAAKVPSFSPGKELREKVAG